jgi:protein tyrosine phosphatase
MKCNLCALCFIFHLFPFVLFALQILEKEADPKRMEEIVLKKKKAAKLFARLHRLSSEAKENGAVHSAGIAVQNLNYEGNFLITPLHSYIVCHAPSESNVANFWKMIIQTNCRLIIMGCMPIESNRNRCLPYWNAIPQSHEVLGWKLSLEKEEVLENGPDLQRIVKRRFSAILRTRHTHIKRTIIQLHLENWRDYSVPDLELFQCFLERVQQYTVSNTPILVHCVAGVGRSGTFVAAHSLQQELLAGASAVNVPKRIYDLRLQRSGLVTTLKQFQFIYRVLLPFFSQGS